MKQLLSIPEPEETISRCDFCSIQEENSANQPVGEARQGDTVYMVGRGGNDSLGNQLLSSLQNNGVDFHLSCESE